MVRTCDLMVNSHTLFQLSYRGIVKFTKKTFQCHCKIKKIKIIIFNTIKKEYIYKGSGNSMKREFLNE